MTASTSKIRSSKQNPCPVCSNHSGCQFTENFSRVWCLRVGTPGEVPAGYRLVGWLNGGMGASLALVDEKEEERQRLERRQQWQQQQESKKEDLKKSLSTAERDRHFRSLLCQVSLSAADRKNLLERGLSDRLIRKHGFASVRPGISLKDVSPSLPGIVLRNGRTQLSVSGEGFLVPVRNTRGEIIGCQLRLNNSDSGKYRWLKGRQTSHLQNGELPLQVAAPDKISKPGLGVTEGTLKPLICAELSEQTFIGASGGHLAGSLEQLKEAIGKHGNNITLFPDAGSAANPHVYRRDCESIRLLQLLGCTVQIADWGQLFDKSRPDFDEYLAAGGSTYTRLTADEFLNIHAAPAGAGDRQQQPWSEEPDPEEYAAWEAWEEQQEQAFEGDRQRREEQKQENQKTWQQSYSTRVGLEWQRLKQITKLSKEFAQRFLNLDLDNDILPGIIGVKSGMGTGKTEFLKQIVKRYERGNVISYRNSLLQNTSGRIPEIDFIWDLDLGDGALNAAARRSSDWTAACIDSLGKLEKKDVLVIEEGQKVFNHLLRGGTCKRKRAQLLQMFQQHCEEATYIIILDADLTDIDLQYIQSLCPNKKIQKIRNTFVPYQWQIAWYVGSLIRSKDEIKEKPNDRRALEQQILDSIAAGETPIICSDNQQWLEAIDNLLKALYPDKTGLRVDSFTKADDPETINKFLEKPNPFIAEFLPDWLLISPTAEASLDITIEHFTIVYGMFIGTIDCYSMRQMLGRYRQPVPRHVFCKTFSRRDNQANTSPLAKVCGKHLHKYEKEAIEHLALADHLKGLERETENADFLILLQALNKIVDSESETWRDPHLNAWSNYQARDNYQKANLRQTLRELLEDAGHTITQELLDVVGEMTPVSGERKSILEDRARRISESPDIPIEEARRILEDMAATTTARFMAEKALLKDRLPGVDLTPEFIYWAKYEDKSILGALENYWMLQHPGCREYLDRAGWTNALQFKVPLWDIRTRSLEIDVLRQLDLAVFASDDEREWGSEDAEILALRDRAVALASRLRVALGLTARPDSDPMYLFRRCAEKLGYDIKSKQRRVDGQRKRFYRIIKPENDAKRAAVLAAYERRFTETLNKAKAAYSGNHSDSGKASQTAFHKENNTENQSVTAELLAVEMSTNEPQQEEIPTWRGLLVRVRENAEIAEFERKKFASMPLGAVLRVNSEPCLGFRADDWHVWCEKPEGGCVAIPCAWLEVVAG